jgi:hypothetical protein
MGKAEFFFLPNLCYKKFGIFFQKGSKISQFHTKNPPNNNNNDNKFFPIFFGEKKFRKKNFTDRDLGINGK